MPWILMEEGRVIVSFRVRVNFEQHSRQANFIDYEEQ
jgi:hypothetical protein